MRELILGLNVLCAIVIIYGMMNKNVEFNTLDWMLSIMFLVTNIMSYIRLYQL